MHLNSDSISLRRKNTGKFLFFMLALFGIFVGTLHGQGGIAALRPSGSQAGSTTTPGNRPSQDTGSNPLSPGTFSIVTGNGIQYHNGAVMTNPHNVYFIWYGNWTGNTALQILPDLILGLDGSGYFGTNSTYGDSNADVMNGVYLWNQIFDNYTQGVNLSDAGVLNVVTNAINGHTLPADPDGIYFVLSSADVNETSGFCTRYCGWHNHATISGTDIKYAFVGDAGRCLNDCADQSTGPNGNAGADAMASVIAHELSEAVTDPDLDAWYQDSTGEENGDICAWGFGSTFNAPNGARANSVFRARNFLIQQNYVNRGGGYCAMSDRTAESPLYVIGTDNQVYVHRFDANGDPSGPYALIPNMVKAISGRRSGRPGAPFLFVIGTDNQVYVHRLDLNGNPTGNYVPIPNMVKAIAGGADKFGTPLLFVIGTDDQVYVHKFDSSGNPTGNYLPIPGQVKAISVGADSTGRPLLFVIGTDDQVYLHQFTASGDPTGPYGQIPSMVKAISASVDKAGTPLLFVIGTDDQVYLHRFTGGGAPMGGYVPIPNPVKAIAGT